ncbi:MAG TPA: hypothetical protein VH740_24290 [Vicinamibacterales bacterium]
MLTPLRASATAVMLCLAAAPSASQAPKSAALAKELTAALEAAKLDSIAAADPSDPNAFVAALYISGSQLLVVSAKYAAPPLLTAKIKSKEYRDVYIDLSAAAMAGSKTFIIDQNCDGLMSKPDNDAAPDSWEAGTVNLSFDGEWRKAKMSEAEYMKAYASAEERYAALIPLLTAQAKR